MLASQEEAVLGGNGRVVSVRAGVDNEERASESWAITPPGPTLHHQPGLCHGTAHAVLGDAEVLPGILWAGVHDPQLAAGEDLHMCSWIWKDRIKAGIWDEGSA